MQLMVLCTVKVLCIVFGCFLPKLLSQVYFCAIMSELGHFTYLVCVIDGTQQLIVQFLISFL